VRVVLAGINLSPNLYSAGLASVYASAVFSPELKAAGVALDLLNFHIDDANDYILGEIWRRRPDVVGFSIIHGNCPKAAHLGELLRRLLPGVRVVWGGVEVSPAAADYLGRYPGVDAIVRDEGEVTFVELLKAWRDGRPPADVAGVTCRDGGGAARSNPPRPAAADPDVFPSPILAGLVPIPGRRDIAQIETYRGCPFKCHYCFEHRGLPGVRSYSMARIQAELGVLLAHRVGLIRFYDTTFNYDRARMEEILRFVVNHNQGSVLHAEMRLELLDEKSIPLLRAAGFREIEFGLQTVNTGALEENNRTWDRRRFERNCRLLHKHGIRPHFHVIGGLPGDSLDDFRRSIDYVQDTLRGQLVIFPFMLIKGSYYDAPAVRERTGMVADSEPPYHALAHSTYGAADMMRMKAISRSHHLLGDALGDGSGDGPGDGLGGAAAAAAKILAALGVGRAWLYEDFADWLERRAAGQGRAAAEARRWAAGDVGRPAGLPGGTALPPALLRQFIDEAYPAVDARVRAVVLDVMRFNAQVQALRADWERRAYPDAAAGDAPPPSLDARLRLVETAAVLSFDSDITAHLIDPRLALAEVGPGPAHVLVYTTDGEQVVVMPIAPPLKRVLDFSDGTWPLSQTIFEATAELGAEQLEAAAGGARELYRQGVLVAQ